MDTKSRKSKPFTAWLCFFLAVSILAGLLINGYAFLMHADWNWADLKVATEYNDTHAFKERTANYYEQLSLAVDSHDPSYVEMIKSSLDNEGKNLQYYAFNRDGKLVATNITGDLSPNSISEKIPDLPGDYKYFWYFDGQKLSVIDHGRPIDIERLDSGYRGIVQKSRAYTDKPADLVNNKIFLAVKDPLVKNPYGHSRYYEEQQFLSVIGWVYISLLVLGLLLLVYAIIRRPEKREFDRKLAAWSGQMWLEVKIVLSLLVLMILGGFAFQIFLGRGDLWDVVLSVTVMSCVIIFCFWWFYLMLIDLIINGKNFFSHNSINSFLIRYHQYEKKYTWQKSMLKRAYMLVATEAVLALISVMFVIAAIGGFSAWPLLLALMIAGAGIYLTYRYLKRYDETLSDLGRLMDHIELIKNGDMKTRLELDANADIYPAAQNLNSIQEGMSIAVAEKMKSERMKIDLITNVSHDLKTPLTSIISYVDLLNKEEALPEHVNDYIKILAQKSERLKNLIQDLFDLSKASTENIALDTEQIDLARLIRQTLADMEEPINSSGLTFRLNIPEEPVYILSDGKKLYRVWENLITNALKYSLTGSRVFIDLTVDKDGALAAIKNTANYEMNFTEEEILQRFVRGDEARTTEGSGLGLSIAQSFTQICGGQFSIKIDGDLFKVELFFKS